LKFENEYDGLKFALVIIKGKKCGECNFIATDQTLLNKHFIEKHLKQGEVKLQNSCGQKFHEKRNGNKFKNPDPSKTADNRQNGKD